MRDATAASPSMDPYTALGRVARAQGISSEACRSLCSAWTEELGALATVLTVFDKEQPEVIGAAPAHLASFATLQFTLGEGPCVEARRSGTPVLADWGRGRRSWPTWTEQATVGGIASVASLPLTVEQEDTPLGTLWACYEEGAAIHLERLRNVWSLATLVGRLCVTQRKLEQRELLATQLQRALDSRVVIEQAKGYVAALEGISPAEAFERLRRQARSAGRRLQDVAREVVEGG